MSNRVGLVQLSCAAVVLLMAAAPAFAKDGRTLWLCGETGCVQVERSALDLIEASAVVVPKIHRAPNMIHPVAASSKAVPIEQLIDMSLVTGVFQ